MKIKIGRGALGRFGMNRFVRSLLGLALLVAGAASSGQTLSDGLQLYYPFTAANDGALDASGFGRHGALVGTTWADEGHPAGIRHFGLGNYINAGAAVNFASWEQYTISTRFRHDTSAGDATGYGDKLFCKSAMNSDQWIRMLPSSPQYAYGYGAINFTVSKGVGPSSRGFSLTCRDDFRDNLWHHIAIVRNGNHAEMWIDGALRKTIEGAMTVSDNTQPIYLGYSPSSDTYSRRYWPGDIDEFRIYNRALSTNEVLELAGNTVVHVTLGVSSLHGLPNPSVGAQTLVRKTAVTATVDAEIPVEEGTRYVCTGWIGSGSVPVSGTANRVDFVITNDSTLVWGWRTEHLLAASVSGMGSVVGSGWYEAGDTVKLVATPSTGHQFSVWNDGDPAAIQSVVVPEGGASYAATFTPIPRGILSFHKTAFSVTENNELGLVALKVERLGGSYGAATVTFKVDPGTATSGNDYFVEPCTATWDSGQTGPRYLVIDIADDALSEGNETLTVRLVDATGASVGEPHEAGVTIVDNEGARARAWWMIWPFVRSQKTAR